MTHLHEDRRLRLVASLSQAALTKDDEAALLAALCKLAVTPGGYSRAWVCSHTCMSRPSEGPWAQAGFSAGDLAQFGQLTPSDFAACSEALQHRQALHAYQTDVEPIFASWRALCSGAEFRVAHVYPIEALRTFGATLCLLGSGPEQAEEHEIALFDELIAILNQGLDRLSAHRALAESNATLLTAQQLARLGSWRLDAQTELISASEEAFAILEIEQNSRLTVRDILALIEAHDREAVLREWRLSSRNGQALDFEFRLAGTSARRWLRVRSLAQYDAAGRLLGIVGTLQDVSERHVAEDKLNKLSLAIEQSPHSIVITDAKGEIEYVNDSFTRNTGYSREEALGGNPRILNSGLTARAVFDDLWQTLEQGKVWQGEFINCRKDGSHFEEWAIISPVRQPDGQVTHYLAIKEDISAKKRDQAELERHRHHLEALVVERTIALNQAKEEAELANRAKSAFLANMSHEIRTPMNAIVGLTHLIRSDANKDGNTEQLLRLDKIASAADHLMSIVNDVLDISNIEAGKLQLDAIAFSPEATVREAIGLVAEAARVKGLSISTQLAPGLPTRLCGDPIRLRQILLNFLSNAIKFSERGEIQIDASILRREGDDWILRCAVTDPGIGISPEIQGRLFNPFEQADSSTTRRYGGTGLGLAISRRLAEAMGGQIGVTSEIGIGSTFWFTARLARDNAGEIAMPNPDATTRLHWHGSARILLAEDNATNEEVASCLLHEAGLQVDVARDGQEAVDLARAHHYDLVLMDMLMPRLDGLEATRIIRELPGWSDIPILAMTASAFNEDRAACLAAGMNDHVPKPVDPSCLEAALSRWLPAHATAAPPTTVPEFSLAEPASSAGTLREALAKLPGVDLELGLRSVRGNIFRLGELLSRFCTNHAGDFDRIRELTLKGETEEAFRYAHSLKGAAGTLGATCLQSAAMALENGLRAGASQQKLDGLIDQCADCHRDLHGAVTAAIEGSSPERKSPPQDDVGHFDLANLIELLQQGDVRAQNLARRHATALSQLLGSGYKAFENSVLDFDFELALARLNMDRHAAPNVSPQLASPGQPGNES